MTKKIITEKEFISFAQNAYFSNQILRSLQKEFEFLKQQDIFLLTQDYKTHQVVKLENIKGSYEIWPPKDYAEKPWIDIIIQEGHFKDNIRNLYEHLSENIHDCNHNLGEITLFNVHGTYFIKNGHKRIALARYFYELFQMPAYLTNIVVIDCKFFEDKALAIQ